MSGSERGSRTRRVLGVAMIGLALAGTMSACAVGPDPRPAVARAPAVFDVVLAVLGDTDPAILRSVTEVAVEPVGCDDAGSVQQPLVARGDLSVQAEDDAAAGVVDAVARALEEGDADGGWRPARAAGTPAEPAGDQRAWSSADGITVVVTDASPAVVVAVFPPCAPAE